MSWDFFKDSLRLGLLELMLIVLLQVFHKSVFFILDEGSKLLI
jgi:hypothetical protein